MELHQFLVKLLLAAYANEQPANKPTNQQINAKALPPQIPALDLATLTRQRCEPISPWDDFIRFDRWRNRRGVSMGASGEGRREEVSVLKSWTCHVTGCGAGLGEGSERGGGRSRDLVKMLTRRPACAARLRHFQFNDDGTDAPGMAQGHLAYPPG